MSEESESSASSNFIRIKDVNEINSNNNDENEEAEENTLNKQKRKIPNWLFESTSSGSKNQNDRCSKKQKFLNDSTSTSNDNNGLDEVNISNSTNQKDETDKLASSSTSNHSNNEEELMANEQVQDVQGHISNQEEPEEQINSTENVIVKEEIDQEEAGSSEIKQEEASSSSVKIEVKQEEASSSRVKIEVKQEEASSSSNNTVSTIVNRTSASTSLPTVVKQEASSTTRDSCKYGIRCYRRNPIHRNEMAHPGDNDYKRPNFPPPPDGTPACRFGDKCYRRNPTHFQDYSHPPSTDFEKNRKERAKRKRTQRKKEDGVIYDYNDSEDEFDNPFLTDSDEDYIPSESEDENSENL